MAQPAYGGLGGLGPWFAATIRDPHTGCTRVISHTYPHLQGGHVTAQVGPFDAWSHCLAFAAEWQQKMDRNLFLRYSRAHDLRYWRANDELTAGKRPGYRRLIGSLKVGCIIPKKKYK